MAVYAIGDLQGCHEQLLQLLDQVRFDPESDQIWLVGDLVNRGPGSLECLRTVRSLGEAAITILGNHDLSLLAQAQESDAEAQANPTLKPILAASDRDELLTWLRHQPLYYRDQALGWSMVHAGLAPDWTAATAASLAREVEAVLATPAYTEFLARLYGNKPDHWHDDLNGWDRLRAIVNHMTRIRLCQPDGRMDLDYKGTLENAPDGLLPWFQLPNRQHADERIVFGHWAALDPIAWPRHNTWCIDTGCVWGGPLSALRLDTPEPAVIHTADND